MKNFLILVLAWSIMGCSSLFFVPDRQLVRTPDMIGLEYQDMFIDVGDGIRLHGWMLPGAPPVNGTIVFLHGNAQNISYHIASVHWLPQHHFNVFLYDYRGFGKSTGTATVSNSINDFGKVMNVLSKKTDTEARHFVVLGQSLGASLAISAVAKWKDQYPIEALVLDSAFSDYRGIAREKVAEVSWLRPFSFLVPILIPGKPIISKDISRISPVPLLLIHGKKDGIIPYQHSRELYRAAKEPKALWLQPDSRHIAAFADRGLRKRLLEYLDKVFTQKLED